MTTVADDTLVLKRTPLAGGVTLESVEQRSPGGTPVIFLHGVTDSWRSFEHVLPHLPRSLRAFALSQRGHGHSSRPETGYAYGDFAADVVAFMEAMALPAAVLVGHSMGGMVAQRVAIDHPQRTLGLVLLGAFASLQGHDEVQAMWDTTLATLADPVDPALARGFQESTLARPIPAAHLDTFVAESLKVPARVWRAAFRGFLDHDHSADLGRIAAPTLIVWGDRDNLAGRSHRDRLAQAIAGAEVLDYEGHGHAVHWEVPGRVAGDIARFVGQLGDRH